MDRDKTYKKWTHHFVKTVICLNEKIMKIITLFILRRFSEICKKYFSMEHKISINQLYLYVLIGEGQKRKKGLI